jgi:hypothetical protein
VKRLDRDLKNKNTRGPAAKLARLLKPYGIRGRTIRLADGATPRGYLRQDFEETLKRYCPPETSKNMQQCKQIRRLTYEEAADFVC